MDEGQEALKQIAEQCKLMTVVMDGAGIQVPNINKGEKWMEDFKKNA